MSVLRIAGYKKHSFVDGPGVRFTVFTQGCSHACPGCHNPETWNMEDGCAVETRALIDEILATRFLDGVTISGGDPMLQADACAEIARAVRAAGLTVWVYTGFTFEQVLDGIAGDAAKKALGDIDVLVDGRFIQSRKDERVLWRGSTNQRLIDVHASLAEGVPVTFDADAYELDQAL